VSKEKLTTPVVPSRSIGSAPRFMTWSRSAPPNRNSSDR